MRVLTWNLFHGRSVPGSGRDLEPEFTAALAGWRWEIALLQEVPPWWGPGLGAGTGASARVALTARNLGLPLRAVLGRRLPDLMKSSGGANAILVRGQAVHEHRVQRLRRRPERRVAHAVRTADGAWWGNLHAQVHSEERAQADLRTAAAALERWAGVDGRRVLGGDTNVRRPVAPGLVHLGGNHVDHVLAHGWRRVGARTLDAGPLSDHAPVLVELAPA